MKSETAKNISAFALGFIIIATLAWLLQHNIKHYLLHVPKQQTSLFLEDETIPNTTAATTNTLGLLTGCGCPDCCSVLAQ